MNFSEINFKKRNRRPVTETTYQIDANEWNALGKEVSRLGDVMELGGDMDTEDAWDKKEYPDMPECLPDVEPDPCYEVITMEEIEDMFSDGTD